MQRLGKNLGGYRGEGIDIEAVVSDIEKAALSTGWEREVYSISPEFQLTVFRRMGKRAAGVLYISTGVHGDEPSGPLAVRTMMAENQWPEELEIYLMPCLNYTGFPLKTRENARGIDLNRDYRHLQTIEVQTHTTWLKKLPQFDLSLCLHEDWEAHGFYVYELNPENRPSLAPMIIEAASEICPIDRSEKIDNWDARDGIIQPSVPPEMREYWAEALYLITNKTRLSYTLETPSDFSLDLRRQAHVAGVRGALKGLVERTN